MTIFAFKYGRSIVGDISLGQTLIRDLFHIRFVTRLTGQVVFGQSRTVTSHASIISFKAFAPQHLKNFLAIAIEHYGVTRPIIIFLVDTAGLYIRISLFSFGMTQKRTSFIIIRSESVVYLHQFVQAVKAIIVLLCLYNNGITGKVTFITTTDTKCRVRQHAKEAIAKRPKNVSIRKFRCIYSVTTVHPPVTSEIAVIGFIFFYRNTAFPTVIRHIHKFQFIFLFVIGIPGIVNRLGLFFHNDYFKVIIAAARYSSCCNYRKSQCILYVFPRIFHDISVFYFTFLSPASLLDCNGANIAVVVTNITIIFGGYRCADIQLVPIRLDNMGVLL